MYSEIGQKWIIQSIMKAKKISDAKDLVKYLIQLSFADETLSWRGAWRVF